MTGELGVGVIGVGMMMILMSPLKTAIRAMMKTTRSCPMTGELGVGVMGVGMTTTLMSPSKTVMRAMTKTTRSCPMIGELGEGDDDDPYVTLKDGD